MRIKWFLIFQLIILTWSANAQVKELSFYVVNAESNTPVDGVHVFIANTTYGDVSDANGQISFSISNELEEDLIISHIGYELLTFEPLEFRNWGADKRISLTPSSIEIQEITISAKRDKKWEKNYKKFKKAFLGNDKIAEQCKILNPEVLRFEASGKSLTATANNLIHIENDYLGYKVSYQLTHLRIAEDQSTEYLGRAFYEEYDENHQEAEKNRDKIFINSPKKFFQALINDQIEASGYRIESVVYNNGFFELIKPLSRDSILTKDSITGFYLVQFDEFLQIVDLNQKEVIRESVGVRRGGLESSRFSTNIKGEKTTITHATSQLYKVAPSILLNKWGNVLNTKQIREYGYWAEQRVAYQLPFNYRNDDDDVKTISDVKDDVLEPTSLSSIEKLNLLLSLLYVDDADKKKEVLIKIVENWEPGFIGPFVEILRLSSDQWLLDKIKNLLAIKYNMPTETSYYEWLQWMWDKDLHNEDYYFEFKASLYKHLDPKFERYFKQRYEESAIRLDEVVWGGVNQDGIPPLRNPEMVGPDKAPYLGSKDVIFGMVINGIAKAYPKRILAWHEFFVDEFGGTKIAGVYCTLCGTMIAYDMIDNNGDFQDLGTSGFLYRSNKLMYDKETQSLWSTLQGKPVLGPLHDKGIELHTHPVVTSTWKEWLKAHPDTEVLSLNTGHDRDYTEGEAYKNYFNNDNLMFPVPKEDKRLKNKDEVFVLRIEGYQKDPLAISVDYLKKNKWYQGQLDGKSFVVVADPSLAVRAYARNTQEFKSFKGGNLTDKKGMRWTISEDALISETGQKLERIEGHNIFWFAWFNVYPKTRLID